MIDEFINAVRQGDLQAVKEMLDADPLLAEAHDDNASALMLSIYHGHHDVAEELVKRRARLNIGEAAAIGDVDEILELYGEDPPCINTFTKDGWTPLHLSAYFGKVDALRTLIERGANIRAVSLNENANTPLHAAVAGGHPKAVRALLSNGAPVDVLAEGWTPLHLAADNGDVESGSALLDSGADPDVPSGNGQRALDIADGRGHKDFVRLLTERNAKE